MSKKPDLSSLLPLFESNADFSLTEEQYEEMTNAHLPQNSKYIEKNSALSRFASKYGFELNVIQRTVQCKKIHKEK